MLTCGGRSLSCLATPGQARPDWSITQSIARSMGLDWSYDGPPEISAEMAGIMPSLDNITWERLAREGAVTYPCDAPDKPGNEIVFAENFPAGNGRAKLAPVEVLSPAKLPDDDFPMVLTTGRQLEHWHTGAISR